MDPFLKDRLGRMHRLSVGSESSPARTDLVKTQSGHDWIPQLDEYREEEGALASLQGLSDLEKEWYSCAAPQTLKNPCKIYLRPGDRFVVGGTDTYTLELRAQDRIEVTSSLPENPSPIKMQQEHNREARLDTEILGDNAEEKEMLGDSVDISQSFVTSGQPRSPTAPPRNTLGSVEETPHVVSRFYAKDAGIPDHERGISPSKTAVDSEAPEPVERYNETEDNAGKATSVSYDAADENTTEPSNQRTLEQSDKETAQGRQPLSQRDSNILAELHNNFATTRADLSGDRAAPDNRILAEKSLASWNKDEYATAATRNDEIEYVHDALPQHQSHEIAGGKSEEETESEHETENMAPPQDEEMFGDTNLETTPTPGPSLERPQKRKLGPRNKTTYGRSAKRSKVVHSGDQDSDTSTIEVRPRPNLTEPPSGPKMSLADSNVSRKSVEVQVNVDHSPCSPSKSIEDESMSPRIGKSQDDLRQTLSLNATPKSSSRSNKSDEPAVVSPYKGKSLKVVFSSNSKFVEHSGFKHFLRKQGGSTGQHVTDKSDILCIGHGEIRKSVSLLLAVAYGKQIVTDSWASKSLRAGHLLNPVAFLPSDTAREKEWNFRVSEISGQPRSDLFADKTIYFTPTLKREYGSSGFREIEEILRACGATSIISRAARDVPENSAFITMVSTSKDADASFLQKNGEPCFHKDLLSMSVLRGSLELESDEFRISPDSGENRSTRKRKIL
ncbi:MAG: hypothetical protein M1821_007133 [Bathelium mastoideum]|nr:MAG: hypothetical protein M1821_007133 [Bathelium mastoideum]